MGTRAWFSVRRRRRSARHDVAAGALIVGVIAVAAVGVYLLAAGAVVLIAWLLRVATKHIAAPLSSPAPSSPPDTPYHPVIPVSPTVFADIGQAKDVAKGVFEAWVARLPRAPKRSIDLVREVEIRRRVIGRLTTELEGRRIVACCEPAPGRHTIGAPPFDPGDIDPWNPPTDLRRASRFIAACRTCSAAGRVACTSCHGSGRRGCASCNGSGKYYGTTANGAQRLLNCKTCRGKGDIACATCTRGKIDCPTCQTAKKLACWLEVTTSLRQDVQVEPDGAMTKAFAWGQDGTPATNAEIAQDAEILGVVAHTRPLGVDDLPAAVPADWRRESWPRIQAHVEASERVRSQTLTLLAVPTAAVSYSIMGEQQTLMLEGLRMLAPPAVPDELFMRRGRMLGRLRLMLAMLPTAAAAIYVARGDYFVNGRAGGLVAGLVGAAAVTAVIAYVVLWYATLGRRHARPWAVAAIAPVILAASLAVLAEPSGDRAMEFVDAGRLDDAAAELRALGAPQENAAWAELHLRESIAAATCTAATAALHEIRSDLPQREHAQVHADELALAEAEIALRTENTDAAVTALACGSEAATTSASGRTLRGRIAAAQAHRCLDAKNWACALEKAALATDAVTLRAEVLAAIRAEADAQAATARDAPGLERRVEHERAALALWREYLVDAQGAVAPTALAALKAALARDEPALAKQQQLARDREAAEAKRQLAAAERQRQQEALAAERERRRQAAEEARSYRAPSGLLCNDGTLSPSCSCGGSHRGCCSHHGGVAGCQ